MIERLIALLFLAREVAHRDHLSAPTISIHMALNEFYDEIVENADSIAEAYQGRMKEVIQDIPILSMDFTGDSATKLRKILSQFESIRYTAVDRDDSAIQNLIDEAIRTFLKTLNKLDNYK
jgi:DNA-binding ferritin-like protein